MNYRLLYFFHDREIVVLVQALTKEAEVPDPDIELALRRRATFRSDPEIHRHEEEE